MLEVKNVPQVSSQIDRWLAKIQKKAEQAARGYAITFLDRLLLSSPQSTGDFAASFNVSLNSIDTSFRGFRGNAGDWLFKQGDRPAIQEAKYHAANAFSNFKLGQTIYISNSAVHDEPYALKVYMNQINFRPENIGADLQAALSIFRLEYAGVLSQSQVRQLQRRKAT
jgi:hypothetical protein